MNGQTRGNDWVCGAVCFGGCLVGCAAGCTLDSVLPIADVIGATAANASLTTASVSACDSAL